MFPGPGGNRGRFIAWDPTVGKVKWEIKENLAAYGGALATASGIVFYGTMEGWLKAVDATTGTELWRFKCPAGINRQTVAYLRPDREQEVAVLSGIGRRGRGRLAPRRRPRAPASTARPRGGASPLP